MAFKIDVEDGIDEGDTKTLRIRGEDVDGAAVPLNSLAVEVVHKGGEGTDETYSLSDATPDGDDYLISHTFDAAGFWSIDVVGEDAQGNTERTSTRSDPVYVNPKPS